MCAGSVIPAFNGVIFEYNLMLFLLNIFSITELEIIGAIFDNIIRWAGNTIGRISMFALFTTTVLYSDVRLVTISLLSKYIHILPFEIPDKNLIALGSILFVIARAYSLMVTPSIDCKIMA